MTNQRRLAAVGFHSGELAAQRNAGVQAQAARLAPMVGPGELSAGVSAFLAGATFAAITARDRSGHLWTSPLLGPPGFLRADNRNNLRIGTAVPDADPLHLLPAGQPAGVLVIDFATRRRVRINGLLTASDRAGLTVEVEQAYGNCPQYIHQRRGRKPHDPARILQYRGESLRSNDIRLIESADTFFLGTTHPDSGNDASHRGGPPGFVRVAGDGLWWPDYPGNNMFNSFGNLAVDPTAALLFVDFQTGATLQLSGTATVDWHGPVEGDDNATGRRVHFITRHVVASDITGLVADGHAPHRPITEDTP
ncbi:pyridoxamine 5'-phosphate oxidase family protein [Mycobacterium sp. Y57]|uniref:pyridoxamine 5'-phosphate oxidase family protein n=1 Tax=Mycolicibacterium xanthum TaxID=2796469 RepID=UPI001C84A86A|nr:pyridoxamine 5'-phosphate oxidase family protein [Mycolicibacterium xanthum]MBX7435241.1 pyridoxamine 5'-phosphate oxidase family protein [Mycolicibacterium xanthum]